MRRVLRWWAMVGLVLAFVTGCRCGDGDESTVRETVAADAAVVETHTMGMIGRDEVIRVRLASDVVPTIRSEAGELPPLEGVLVLTPDVPGEAAWSFDNEITFTPSESLPNGQVVHVEARLSKLGEALKDFSFNVEVRPQTMRFVQRALSPGKGGTMTFEGTVETGDPVDDEAVERMAQAVFEGRTQTITWDHDTPTRHHLEIEGLPRGEDIRQLTLTLDGTVIGATEVVERLVRVPARGKFSVTQVVPVVEGSPRIEVRFSELLDADQDLRGLVTVTNLTSPRIVIEGEVVGVYVGDAPTGSFEVRLEGIQSAEGQKLDKPFSQRVTFGPQDPAVRFAGRGVILPRSADLTLPIEVRNVQAVWLEAIAVPQANLPQFLQVNDLDGNNQMRRVGRRVWRKHVDVPQARGDANRWRRVGLDLADFVADNPAGLYQLSMRFLPQDVVYDCATPPEPIPLPSDTDFTVEQDDSYWDPFDGFGWDYSYWENRDNPCHIGFYVRGDGRQSATRNVAISDLGVTVKSGADDEVFVAVTDLVTARPVADAAITLLDYQTQPIGQATTNEQGIVRLNAERKPLIAVAERGPDRTLVRLNEGGALSTAHFDVGGVDLQRGLKGFLYGERGVWRPGDDIHLTLLRFDRTGQLPSEHPVEFKLIDPRGKVVERRTVPGGPDGFTRFDTKTRPDAVTGPYVVEARVGSSTFRDTVRVETIKPNRLKIDLDFGTERIEGRFPQLDAKLDARWLFGAPSPGLRTNIEVRYSKRATTFPKYAEYSFSDPRRVDTYPVQVFEGRLGDDSSVAIKTSLDLPDEAPGMLNATFLTRVFEPSGNASIDEVTIPVSPHDRYVGVKLPKGDAARGMLLTDKPHKVELVLVDDDGNPIRGSHDIDVEIYEISWRWWWEASDGDLADYASRRSHRRILDDSVTVRDGKGSVSFEVPYPEWGRFLVVAKDRNGSHHAAKPFYVDWPGWAGRAQKEGAGGATVLSVTAADADVEVGDDVTINIPAAASGRALVTLETSTHVVDAEWIELSGQDQQYTFKATDSMVPNVYANVTLVQPHQGTGSDLPIRMYGITPIEVTSPNTVLEPQIRTKGEVRPESTFDVTVSEKNGLPMTYTLAMVDEGLLGITRFQTPDPHKAFHAREALGVDTWDAYGYVAGAYGGALEGVIAIGGDGEGENPPSQKARRFPPVVQVMGPFELRKGKKQTHSIAVPEYIGEVRVMVVAAKDGRFGRADRPVQVKAPLMVAATLPRVLGPQEDIDLPVNVWLLDDKLKKVDLKVEVDGPITLEGPASRDLAFGKPGEALTQFALKTTGVGLGRVVVTGKSGRESITQTMEIDVRPSTQYESRTLGSLAPLAPGEQTTVSVTPFGLPGTSTATLELSNLPPIDLDRRLQYLVRYPYGCAEQTTSAAFPQVKLKSLVDLTPQQSQRVDRNIKVAIDKLRRYQAGSGGFAMWPGGESVNDYISSWIGQFLVEADRAGFRVPDAMLLSWLDYQTNAARRWQPGNDDYPQAYRLYTLALAGDPEIGAMNRLKARSSLTDEATWKLAAAYALAGQPDTGKKLVRSLSATVGTVRTETGGTFRSRTRDRAVLLESLAVLEPNSERTAQLLANLAGDLSSDRYLNTQAIGTGLVAMARYSEALGAKQPMRAEVSLDGKSDTYKSDRPFHREAIALAGTKPVEVVVSNRGEGGLWARIVNSGLPAPGNEIATNEGIRVTVTYVNDGGFKTDVSRADHGMDFKAVVNVQNDTRERVRNVALATIFPSGWEIHGQQSGRAPGIDYKDVRDDRVNFFFDLNAGEAKRFEIPLNASYRGRFYLPQFTAEAMYDPTVSGSTRGRWVTVSPLGPTASLK